MKKTPVFFIAMLFVSNMVTATEIQPGTMNADSIVLKDANASAPALGQINKGTAIKIIDRSAGWMKVQSGSTIGWVKALAVKRDAKSGGISMVASGRGATGQIVSTSGTRGLDAAALKTAKFNQSELDALDRYTVDKSVARQFAQSVHLQPVKLNYPQ